jgi:hypothetical protein
MVLTEDIALFFRACTLTRDVIPIIARWQASGAELTFGIEEFEQTFDIVQGAERQFQAFDTEGKGKVDAHEVLMVYILMSLGDLPLKIDTVFTTFGFAGSKGPQGTINFDEAMLIIEACVQGVSKVCRKDFYVKWDPNEAIFHCRSLFDMHRASHAGKVSLKQFKDWVQHDPSPRAFVTLVHQSQGHEDVQSAVAKMNELQGRVFQKLACGQTYVTPDDLLGSEAFRSVLDDPSQQELDMLITLMRPDTGDTDVIEAVNYHAVLRAWNVFN